MEFDVVQKRIDGIPHMTPERARRVYDHLDATAARRVLELGTAHGVSAAYMAASVGQRGGTVTTVDHVEATKLHDPSPGDVLSQAGLDDVVTRVLVQDSSYTWWLGGQIAEHTRGGVCEPVYDFVYVDGAHNWTIDGFAFFLVEKLLRPGGWILLDDLAWSYGETSSSFGPGQGPDALGLSTAEQAEPHMKRVFELLVAQHPDFCDLLVEDEDWGWAHKSRGGSREIRRESTVNWRSRLRGLADGAIGR
jgi:predicted O-methyltransferase YrrM